MEAMGIQENLEILKKVQEVDRQIYETRADLKLIPLERERIARELEEEKAHLHELEERLKAVQLEQRKKEGELVEKENLIRKYDTQLTQVKTNKEYSALQSEINSLKADSSMIEDAVLELLDQAEEVGRQVKEEKDRLSQVEREAETEKKTLQDREDNLTAGLKELREKRKETVNQVPDRDIRALYERIIEKKENLALVAASGEVCGACQIQLRPQTLNELKLKENLVVCENCSRILYLES